MVVWECWRYAKALQGRTLLDKLYCICLIPWRLCRVPRGEIPEQKTDAYISGVWYTMALRRLFLKRLLTVPASAVVGSIVGVVGFVTN